MGGFLVFFWHQVHNRVSVLIVNLEAKFSPLALIILPMFESQRIFFFGTKRTNHRLKRHTVVLTWQRRKQTGGFRVMRTYTGLEPQTSSTDTYPAQWGCMELGHTQAGRSQWEEGKSEQR